MRAMPAWCGVVVVAWCGPSAWAGADEVRALVSEMMSDARTRSTLSTEGVRVEEDGTFTLVRDGGASLRVRGELQFRYLYNAGGNEEEGGFQMRRSRLEFRGRVCDGVTYRVRGDWDRRGGTFRALSVTMGFVLDEVWSLRVGQLRAAFDRETGGTGATRLVAVERSILSTMVRTDRELGVTLRGRWDRVGWSTTIGEGFGDAQPFAVRSRVELRLGDAGWGQHRRQSWRPGDEGGGLVGLGVSWQGDGRRGRPVELMNESVDLYQYSADLGFGGDGAGVLMAVSGRTFEGGGSSITDWGAMVQASAFSGARVEWYARYAHLFPGARTTGGDDDIGAVSVGVNWYPLGGGRALRLSADLTYYLGPQADSSGVLRVPDTSINLLADDDGGQLALTLQAQIAF